MYRLLLSYPLQCRTMRLGLLGVGGSQGARAGSGATDDIGGGKRC